LSTTVPSIRDVLTCAHEAPSNTKKATMPETANLMFPSILGSLFLSASSVISNGEELFICLTIVVNAKGLMKAI
jgi:hypothetical protein